MRLVANALGVALALLATLTLYAWLRPNRASVDPALGLEHWPITGGRQHDSNTDLIAFGDDLLLVHATSPWHLGSTRSRLLVKRSGDAGRSWETLAQLSLPGHDIRDPKLARIGGELFLYALPNRGLAATPIGTVLATSRDGRDWTPFEPVGPEGWLFWRPKTRDGRTWFVSAYWKDHGRSILLRSEDGRRWDRVSQIHAGDGNDETAIEFLPDGRLIATARLEVTPDRLLGHDDAGTAIAVADPPYTEWREVRTRSTRLDGPVLFRHDERVYAIARWQPPPHGGLRKLGGTLARKRTGLYRVEPERLVYLGDLPSAGDTSYAGAVIRDGALWTEYYTSRIDRDYPWLLGMFLPTELRMARIPLSGLDAVSDAHP